MIGLLGGTFDPVHYGHLRSALDVFELLTLDELRLIPLNQAVHRAQPQAPAAARLAMVQAAVADQPGLIVDDREIERDGPSRTYDTLVSLRAELGLRVPLCLLIGADAFSGFLDWHRPLDILDLTHLVVMQRPEAALPRDINLRTQLQERRTDQLADLRAAPGGRIWVQSVTQLAISATAIRHQIATGRSARFLLPDAVLEMIHAQQLYRTEHLSE